MTDSRESKVVKKAAEADMKFDYIICAHKAIQQDTVPDDIAPAVDPARSTIVIIQNGVGNEEPFRNRFPSTTIISCVVSGNHEGSLARMYSRLTFDDQRHGQVPFSLNLDTSGR
jgi:ketopantoate reductase